MVFCGVPGAQYLVLCAVLCRYLLVFLFVSLAIVLSLPLFLFPASNYPLVFSNVSSQFRIAIVFNIANVLTLNVFNQWNDLSNDLKTQSMNMTVGNHTSKLTSFTNSQEFRSVVTTPTFTLSFDTYSVFTTFRFTYSWNIN